MASYVIKAVRKVPVNAPARHQHIAEVQFADGRSATRAQVIAAIADRDTFTTISNPPYPPGHVYVHPCPTCGARDYITTHPDNTVTNNLDNLPSF